MNNIYNNNNNNNDEKKLPNLNHFIQKLILEKLYYFLYKKLNSYEKEDENKFIVYERELKENEFHSIKLNLALVSKRWFEYIVEFNSCLNIKIYGSDKLINNQILLKLIEYSFKSSCNAKIFNKNGNNKYALYKQEYIENVIIEIKWDYSFLKGGIIDDLQLYNQDEKEELSNILYYWFSKFKNFKKLIFKSNSDFFKDLELLVEITNLELLDLPINYRIKINVEISSRGDNYIDYSFNELIFKPLFEKINFKDTNCFKINKVNMAIHKNIEDFSEDPYDMELVNKSIKDYFNNVLYYWRPTLLDFTTDNDEYQSLYLPLLLSSNINETRLSSTLKHFIYSLYGLEYGANIKDINLYFKNNTTLQSLYIPFDLCTMFDDHSDIEVCNGCKSLINKPSHWLEFCDILSSNTTLQHLAIDNICKGVSNYENQIQEENDSDDNEIYHDQEQQQQPNKKLKYHKEEFDVFKKFASIWRFNTTIVYLVLYEFNLISNELFETINSYNKSIIHLTLFKKRSQKQDNDYYNEMINSFIMNNKTIKSLTLTLPCYFNYDELSTGIKSNSTIKVLELGQIHYTDFKWPINMLSFNTFFDSCLYSDSIKYLKIDSRVNPSSTLNYFNNSRSLISIKLRNYENYPDPLYIPKLNFDKYSKLIKKLNKL